jgi:hypothetical protein
MNRCIPVFILLALSRLYRPTGPGTRPAAPCTVAGGAKLPNSGNNNPYNSPIRRANPNSMQGTQPSAPAIRRPNTVPVPRPPTLDNGGIGNGADPLGAEQLPPAHRNSFPTHLRETRDSNSLNGRAEVLARPFK